MNTEEESKQKNLVFSKINFSMLKYSFIFTYHNKLKTNIMAKMKDFFGNATSGFKRDNRGGETRESQGSSLYDQLEKFGTPTEKAAVRQMKANRTVPMERNFKINAWS